VNYEWTMNRLRMTYKCIMSELNVNYEWTKINYKWIMGELNVNYEWIKNKLQMNDEWIMIKYKLGWKCSFMMAITASFPPLMINFIRNSLKFAWISLMKFFHFFKSIWKMSNLLPCWFTNVIALLMDEVLQLMIWYLKIQKKSTLYFYLSLISIGGNNSWIFHGMVDTW
jgi:hypothetical protein